MSQSALHVRLAARTLRAGGVVACPTEAVWGLSCNPFDRDAVMRLLAMKQRPAHKGLVVVASHVAQLSRLLAQLPPADRSRLYATWPGPFTWVVPNHGLFPDWVTGGAGTVAVRVTAHPLLAALCDAFGGALVSTSANVSGQAPARSALAVRRKLRALPPDYLLPGALGNSARPTAIRDLATGRLLRPS